MYTWLGYMSKAATDQGFKDELYGTIMGLVISSLFIYAPFLKLDD